MSDQDTQLEKLVHLFAGKNVRITQTTKDSEKLLDLHEGRCITIHKGGKKDDWLTSNWFYVELEGERQWTSFTADIITNTSAEGPYGLLKRKVQLA